MNPNEVIIQRIKVAKSNQIIIYKRDKNDLTKHQIGWTVDDQIDFIKSLDVSNSYKLPEVNKNDASRFVYFLRKNSEISNVTNLFM